MQFNSVRLRLLLILLFFSVSQMIAGEPLSPQELLHLKRVDEVSISPGGEWIAYTVEFSRQPDDEPGNSYKELYQISVKTGNSKPLLTGKVSVKSLAWKPDGSSIGFLMKKDDPRTQVWSIPLTGGEPKQLTNSKTSVADFRWHPKQNKIGYLADTPKSDREKVLAEKGYNFIFYEENLKHQNFYLLNLDDKELPKAGEQLTEGMTVWSFEFSPDGNTIAATISPENLIDHRYMFRNIFLVDLRDKSLRQLSQNQGKLGNMAFSPDGAHLSYAGALDRKDNQVSQAFVIPLAGGETKNLTPLNFRGHVNWVGWKDSKTLLYRSFEGMETTFSTVGLSGGQRNVILNSRETGVVFELSTYTGDFKHFALAGESPEFPPEVFYWSGGKNLKRLTELNPHLKENALGKQEIIRYNARDGLEIEGLLIYPVDYRAGQTSPLMVIVHGGPEHNWSNGWNSRYSEPGQVFAGRGYAVFYPNYRASTGYGTDFALQGLNDAAGKEFDDIADGIDYLAESGIADRNRVGLAGGSYGGYAAAWFASYYTQYVKAVCMYVGVSNLISKRSTTDIPYEELFVHSEKKLEEMWEFSLQRSPVYWAHQSKTAVLIIGGTADKRVEPSQSLEFYRRLKINDHPAVRLVQYPGEKHRNSEQPGRIDVMYRTLEWFDWYVNDAKPLDGPLPPLDISDKYGLDLPQKDSSVFTDEKK